MLHLTSAACLLIGITPRVVTPQSASQLAAFDALMLSPIGALSPIARDPADAGRPGNVLSLRYGRWRYDADDAVHDNIGLTWARRFAFARTEVVLIGAYAVVECRTCSGWAMGGLAVQSTVFAHVARSNPERAWRTAVGSQLNLGGARYRGAARASTRSASLTLPLEAAVPLWWTHAIGITVFPGFGYGSISTSDLSQSGFAPIVGGSIAWTITSHLVLNVGGQRVVIPRGTTQFGASMSWVSR